MTQSAMTATAMTASVTASVPTAIADAIAKACGRIAPLWPLKHFVAVNPFLGFADRSFAATCATLRRVAGVEMLLSRAALRAALSAEGVTDTDLVAALDRAPPSPAMPRDLAVFKARLAREPQPMRPGPVVATVAEVLDRLAAGDRQASRTAFMIDEISRWCAAYFDQGQAPWKLPSRSEKPYPAWRAAMRHDLNAEVMGIRGFRAAVAAMPEEPAAAIAAVIAALGIPARAVEDYLYRALFDIQGWAAYVRYLGWDNALYGHEDDRLVHLLAIRVVWGYALFCERRDEAFAAAWAAAMREAANLPQDETLGEDEELATDIVAQLALEIAYQRRLFAKLAAAPAHAAASGDKLVQAAFCIDVRSEVYRRALESVTPAVETLGFAGFFGFPIEYVPIGQERGGAQCPVLLKPAFTVCEGLAGADGTEEAEVLGLRLLRRRAAKAWKAFKVSAVSSFTYVESIGLGFAAKLFSDSAGVTRPVPHPHLDGLDRAMLERVGPRLEPRMVGGRQTGFDPAQRIAMAEAVLRAMSLTDGFARLVLLVGHGSTTVNNPHASGLDCGACGGHTGEANARVAAGILNDPHVREGLAARGIVIPAETWFVGCLHDTTTDEIRIFDAGTLPAPAVDALERTRGWLRQASALARAERAALLDIDARGDVDADVLARSRDWSQVRPEWGLAGNAAFVAAPRARTLGADLGGRSFLHSYDWRQDKDFGVLKLIMTAPMVVASWINLQYYGSTVNNRAFGAGNKVLHNVVGQLGVLEGNAGDLRVGLPWQSVHDGARFVHQPLRLTVVIEAPEAEMNRVIAAEQGVRRLVDNGWVHLFRIAEDGRLRRYAGGLAWQAA
jgi:uncharacterized protein YbcC (UPF0753/DUF2309 family)